ncbi:MAG: alkaline phosphatase family protein [Ginsengibacter sp.]
MKVFSTSLFFILSSVISSAQVKPAHTVICILENRAYNNIVGNVQAPYINSILSNAHTALLTNSFGLTHPSQPNYLLLYSGATQGVTNNNVPTGLPFTTLNLGSSLISNNLGFIGYSEDLPSVGSTVITSGAYVRKHNPWVNWQGTGTNSVPAASNRPFSDFPTDYNLLPTVSIVVPNLDNDMHDGSIATGDTWLRNNLDGYVQWCINNNSLFILTFDEDDNSSGNHILTSFTGEDVKGGSYGQHITHHNILRTVEDLYQLPYAGASADSTAVSGIWLSAQTLTYTFIGNGNWNDLANWSGTVKPPRNTYTGSKIVIDNVVGGKCIVNVPYSVSAGTTLDVKPGSNLQVNGNLVVN